MRTAAMLLTTCTFLLAAATADDHMSLLQTRANFSLSRGLGLQAPLTSAEQVEQLRLGLQAAGGDVNAQQEGCNDLVALADTQREEPGPYGGWRVSDELLIAGIGEALAEGLRSAVALEVAQGLTSPGQASMACWKGINGLTVQNDFNKGLLLITHAPHLWESVMSMFNAFRTSSFAKYNLCFFAGMFGTPQHELAATSLVQSGAVDFLMSWFEEEWIRSDPSLMQRLWCGLSDIVHESSGVVGRAMAAHQGSMPGIPLLVRGLRWAKESNSSFHEVHGYGLLYEAVHVIGGVMEHDDANHSFAKSFVSAGLLEELVPAMRMEPNDRILQDMSCEAIKWVTDDNVAVQARLVDMGVLATIADALVQHSHPPSLDYGIVTIACSTALLNFARTSAEWREQLRSLRVYDTLDEEVFQTFPRNANDDFLMRREWFSNNDIYVLKEMLTPPEP